MLKRTIAIAVALAAATATARADVSYGAFMFNARNASGTPIANGTYVMVADLNGDGWGGTPYGTQTSGQNNSASWLWDAQDLLMDRGPIGQGSSAANIAGEAYPFRAIATASIPAGYTADTDHYYILWFDTPYSVGAAGPGKGVKYGVEDLGTLGADPGDYSAFPVGGNATLTTFSDVVAASWHNATLAGDVNGDGSVTQADAQLVIDKLNLEGPHALATPGDPLFADGGKWWDVTDDPTPYISPLDALRVINSLQVGSLLATSDRFSVVTPVPEPASVLLLLAGGGWLAARRRGRAAA